MVEDRVAIEMLSRIAEDTPWEAFEAVPDGRLILFDRAQTMLKTEEQVDPRGWVFDMRCGVHLGRSAQAIMSCGHFIRVKFVPQLDRLVGLKTLDPANPSTCLYQGRWHPAIPAQPYVPVTTIAGAAALINTPVPASPPTITGGSCIIPTWMGVKI